MSSKRVLTTTAKDDVVETPRTYSDVAKLLAEFVGTFALVFTACNNNSSGSQLGSISVACSLMVGIYALGSVSGAHFNPAVTLGVFLDSVSFGGGVFKKKLKDAALYWLVQLIAGICAGLASGGVWTSTLGGPSSGGPNATVAAAGELMLTQGWSFYTPLGNNIDEGLKLGYGIIFLAEAIYTCVLVFVVLNVATCNDTKPEKNHYFGLAIGFVIAAGATAIGSISGCSLNPAVSIGVAFNAVTFDQSIPFLAFVYYSFCELAGATLAFGLFAVCRAKFKAMKGKIGMPSKVLSEFFGTFVLTLTVCLVVSQGKDAPIVGLVGIASSLMVGIYSLGAVSGANFNPAVSTGLLLIKELKPVDYAAYLLAQIIGGLVALGVAVLLRANVWSVALVTDGKNPLLSGAAQGTWGAITGAEFFYTFLLVFVVLNVAVRDAGNQYYGLAIGFVIVAGGAAVGGLSGGVFNPAIAIALDIGSTRAEGSIYGYGWIYVLIELAAAGAAAGVYSLINMKASGEDSDDEAASSSDA